MFNKTYINQTPKETYSTSKVEVHEYKAPTDESLKLLKQFKDEAVKDIIKELVISTTLITFVALQIRPLAASISGRREQWFLTYEINGRTYTLKVILNLEELQYQNKTKAEIFVEKVSQSIVEEMLKSMTIQEYPI